MRKAVVILALVGAVALLGLVAAVSFAHPTILAEDHVATIFADWKVHNRKFYFNNEEHNYRMEVFKSNLADIMAHNAKPEKTYTKAINMFSDLTSEEFIHFYTGAKVPELLEEAEIEIYDETNVPSSVDWRQKGAVTGVKNQGHCGSCWSFSSTGVFEGAYFQKHGSLKSFSEQQLVDCTYGQGNYGCNGGWPYNALKYMMNGEELETSYPYTAKDGSCSFSPSKAVAKTTGYKKVSSSTSQLTAAVASQPVSICVDATPMQSYSSGIIMADECTTRINHAVLAVGY